MSNGVSSTVSGISNMLQTQAVLLFTNSNSTSKTGKSNNGSQALMYTMLISTILASIASDSYRCNKYYNI